MLVPVLKESFLEGDITTADDQEYLEALVCAFDKNAAKALENKEGELWGIFTDMLLVCLTKGKCQAVNNLDFPRDRFNRPPVSPEYCF